MIKYSSIYGLLHAHHAYFFAHCSTLPVHFCHISIHMYISYLLHNECINTYPCISTIFRLLSERPLSPWIDSFWSDGRNKNTWKNCKNGFDIYAMVLLLKIKEFNFKHFQLKKNTGYIFHCLPCSFALPVLEHIYFFLTSSRILLWPFDLRMILQCYELKCNINV